MKVLVYDLGQILSVKLGVPFDIGDKNALIVGKDKVILTDMDAIHTLHNVNETIQLTDPSNSNSKKCSIAIKDLIDKKVNVPVDEVELGIFVRTFSARIERNYELLLKSIKEIGLDPKDYPRNI
jgi:hypothetical protein